MEVIFRVTGIVFETTAKFPIICNPINDDTPIAISLPKRSGAFADIWSPLAIKNMNNEIITITPINPHSSANIAKMKSFCGSGI